MSTGAVAVIGAGIAGLACARRLAEAGLDVHLLERSRAPGGRVATRRFEAASFDHGAQYLTVRDAGVADTLRAAAADGAVARWQPRWPGGEQEQRELWVGTPGMSALPRWLAQPLVVEYGVRIVALRRDGSGWLLQDDRGTIHPGFSRVVLAMPAPAAAELARGLTPLAVRVAAVPMAPCWAAMLAFEQPLEGLPDAEFSERGPLAWFARNSSKPGRESGDAWVLHASGGWSREALETDGESVLAALAAALAGRVGRPLPSLAVSDVHRWRQARVEAPLGEPFLYDAEAGLGFCGDWCIDARVEAAWLSGAALAARLLQR